MAKLESYLKETIFTAGQRLTTSDQEFAENTFLPEKLDKNAKSYFLFLLHQMIKTMVVMMVNDVDMEK